MNSRSTKHSNLDPDSKKALKRTILDEYSRLLRLITLEFDGGFGGDGLLGIRCSSSGHRSRWDAAEQVSKASLHSGSSFTGSPLRPFPDKVTEVCFVYYPCFLSIFRVLRRESNTKPTLFYILFE